MFVRNLGLCCNEMNITHMYESVTHFHKIMKSYLFFYILLKRSQVITVNVYFISVFCSFWIIYDKNSVAVLGTSGSVRMDFQSLPVGCLQKYHHSHTRNHYMGQGGGVDCYIGLVLSVKSLHNLCDFFDMGICYLVPCKGQTERDCTIAC